MFDPASTYRIQFHKDFTFKNLQSIIPYLHQLGIKTLYASPLFEATPGSSHGYDVVDPLNINPEIGTLDELRAISVQLKELGVSWLQDIVPNHMAYHPNNKWLMDVLENGKGSAYASFFDIGWDSDVYNGRIMVPFLGLPFDEAVEQKQIQMIKKDGKLYFDYFGQQYPVKVDAPKIFTQAYLKKVNADSESLKEISNRQAYQLCHWQETDRQINYRRFFTVNGLICLNVQHEEVFLHYHKLIKQLLDESIFQGLRVDHIDGLYDPKTYLQLLRELAGPDTYITVEKILETGEAFPFGWPVQGNTGYDFLAVVNNVFTNTKSERAFTNYYQKLMAGGDDVERGILEKKTFILKQHMAGELENLYQLFKSVDLALVDEIAAIGGSLKNAIAQLLIYCPVYRFYGNTMPLTEAEAKALISVMDSATKGNPDLKHAFQILKSALLERTQHGNVDYNDRALHFYQRLMQFTGPLMAKGVEDTLMYTYNRFIGHNEVGDSAASFGITTDKFHGLMIDRQRNWPLSLNGTSTHDTKRGEDVRTRLNVLTDIPDEWFRLVKQWQRINSGLKTNTAPDENDEYFIYQSILGAYPMPQSGDDNIIQRMQEYLIKALREGKKNSDWAAPNEVYEEAVKNFIVKLLDKKSDFMQSFIRFHQRVADYGIINSLSQILLKFTCPGVPDVYQGCELWDSSLVDPDNRRPVDYQTRKQYLQKENDVYSAQQWQQLWEKRYNGEIKLQLTQRLLHLRSADTKVFATGEYREITVIGKYKNNILAFARQHGATWYVTIVPLHMAELGADNAKPLEFDWQDTAVVLPDGAPRNWENLLAIEKGYAAETLPVLMLFKDIPVALLKLERPAHRGAGLLLHITSLPSPFGSGDIGPEAYKFIDFLFSSGQRYWQMLPVNPVDKGAGYSPYSANSSIAGNTLLISPELLVTYGWLSAEDISGLYLPSTNRADFDQAVVLKAKLFDKAYINFIKTSSDRLQEFEQYKALEAYWLDDFALYQVLKQTNKNMPWYEWEKPVKNRDKAVLERVTRESSERIDKEKWLQYIFSKQWAQLKGYAEKKGVILFGDMPFYISYDSVDVWSHPEFFKLDEQGKIEGIAGVPPDYFSAEGQLWGMPVYNWEVLRQDNYNWWVQRIRKNLEYFNLIRLDHFRAFSAYWEVSGSEQTAINGKWVQGPGVDFFDKIKAQLGHLPFVAEDLGDIDDAVHELRDEFCLPGMRVLQFAFGGETAVSDHAPHNYTTNTFAYTGTHDNNTLKGWFAQDVNKVSRKAVSDLVGQRVSEKNICSVLIRQCYGSVAKTAIVPVQDVLELDGSQRMNLPASADGNWTWRLTDNQLSDETVKKLQRLTMLFNR
ncbi:malto-oligosyltrehalose synthase [Mucilaginibacter sp. HD30]